MAWTNRDALHRHAWHAYEDFRSLRQLLGERESELWHSLSHHLRHAVFRSGLEVGQHKRHPVRRRFHQ